MRTYFYSLFIFFPILLFSQDEAQLRQALLLDKCSFDPTASAMVVEDRGHISLNNDYSFKYDRTLLIKFFNDKRLDHEWWSYLFYLTPDMARYYGLQAQQIELEPTTKETVKRDVVAKILNNTAESASLKIRKGNLLLLTYSVNFPYNGKIPAWRLQAPWPVALATLIVKIPELVNLQQRYLGNIELDLASNTDELQNIRLSNQTQTLRINIRNYQLSNIPALEREPFADLTPDAYAQLKFVLLSLKIDNIERGDFALKMADKIVEQLSIHPSFTGRLFPDFELKKDYDNRIRSISDSNYKLMRIYDLVRRHFTWNRKDSIYSSKPLIRLWEEKKGNATDINLVLVKLLQKYGYDASPLLVCTRQFGRIDTLNFSLDDFNRAVACVQLGDRKIILDASNRYAEFPLLNPQLLNTYGLLIGMDEQRWVAIRDTAASYKNETVLLAHLSGDSIFRCNAYVNSSGYAKTERVEVLERDSVRGLKNLYFGRDAKRLRLQHFIVANEYIDSLPLAQEFDIRIPYEISENLVRVPPVFYTIPDTLLQLTDGRKLPINFGYNQHYSLVSQFSFTANYEVYVMPNNIGLTALDGAVSFQREFHRTSDNFSLRLSLKIDRSFFDSKEANDLGKFLHKIKPLMQQPVLLRKLY